MSGDTSIMREFYNDNDPIQLRRMSCNVRDTKVVRTMPHVKFQVNKVHEEGTEEMMTCYDNLTVRVTLGC